VPLLLCGEINILILNEDPTFFQTDTDTDKEDFS